jgi:hypothetical protein
LLAPDLEDSDMTLFYSHEDRFADLTGAIRSRIVLPSRQIHVRRLRRLARHAVSRIGAALGTLHQAIVTAKTRRLARELIFRPEAYDDWSKDLHKEPDPGQDATKLPQRPLILGDKWDF